MCFNTNENYKLQILIDHGLEKTVKISEIATHFYSNLKTLDVAFQIWNTFTREVITEYSSEYPTLMEYLDTILSGQDKTLFRIFTDHYLIIQPSPQKF